MSRIITLLGATVLLVAVCVSSASAQGSTVRYVDDGAPAGGDGLSWNTAHRFLRDALSDALFPSGTVTEIRVAQGLYQPDRDAANPLGSGSRFANFFPIAGVEIRGGYAGVGAPNPDSRDIALFESVLTGDLSGDDGPGFTNNGENSLHVVFVSQQGAARSYDGFTITGGNDDGAQGVAGGVRISSSARNFTLRNCNVTGNRATIEGGGVWIFWAGTRITIDSCVISNNESDGLGAGLYIENASPTLVDCVIQNNTAVQGPVAYGGGAYVNLAAAPLFLNCLFLNNVADANGGGAYVAGQSSPTFAECLFQGNTASSTSGLHLAQGSQADLFGTAFIDNVSPFGVGGISVPSDGAVTLTNCLFFGNESNVGAIKNSGTAVMTGCVFSGNRSLSNGGAIFCSGSTGSTILRNCSFAGNTARTAGGAVFVLSFTSIVTITNSAFWGNTDGSGNVERAQVRAFSNFAVSIDFSLVQNWSGALGGIGNANTNPLFVLPAGNDGIPGTGDDNLHLRFDSPAINAGDPAFIPAPGETDIDGDPRRLGKRVDIGADEFLPDTLIRVRDGVMRRP